LTSSAINADNVAFEGKTVTFKGVSISPTDSDKGAITVKSTGDLNVESGTPSRANSFKAYQIVFTAGGDMTLKDLVVNRVTQTKDNNFTASAVGPESRLELERVGLAYSQNVALDAQTIVLKDVQFKAGAALTFTSRQGVISTPANGQPYTRGWVNIFPNVMYGSYDLHQLSEYMDQFGTATLGNTKGIPAAKFPEVANAVSNHPDPTKRADLSNITIRAKPAN
jgi:hypothetical protein